MKNILPFWWVKFNLNLTCNSNLRLYSNKVTLIIFRTRYSRDLDAGKWLGNFFKDVYMSSSFGLLTLESRDLSQAEKEITSCKAEQIHKLTSICTQNGPRLSFWVKIVLFVWICSALQAVLPFSAWEKSRGSTPNSQKLEHMKSTLINLQ